MLPKCFEEWHPATLRPIDINDDKSIRIINSYTNGGDRDSYIYELIITIYEAKKALDTMNIDKHTAFYEFYSTYICIDSSEQEDADLMYDLNEILEDYKNPFCLWDKYPSIGKRYLQLSSIEGEWSYFYDKETDALYGVDWGEMDDFMAGKLDPLFTSFYDFLEWYYSEEDED